VPRWSGEALKEPECPHLAKILSSKGIPELAPHLEAVTKQLVQVSMAKMGWGEGQARNPDTQPPFPTAPQAPPVLSRSFPPLSLSFSHLLHGKIPRRCHSRLWQGLNETMDIKGQNKYMPSLVEKEPSWGIEGHL
jgi:hypothetical protein